MQKLRNAYHKYQSEIQATNPRFVNAEKTNKLVSMADGEMQKMRVKQDFIDYDQAAFYRDKFSKLSDIAIKCEQKKISDQNYHKTAREIVKDNFISHHSNPPINQNISFGNNMNTGIKQRTKSPLKQFFDEHQQKNSRKVNFSSILQKEDTPLKYGLKSVSRSKTNSIIRPKNKQIDQQLRRLETENRRLKQQLNQQKKNLSVNDEQRLRELKNRVKQLDDENRRLKTEMSKSSKSDILIDEQYDPYNLKVRENNIVRIHNKNLYLSEKISQFGGVSEDFQRKTQRIYFDSQTDYIRPQQARRLSPTPNNRNSEEDVLNSSQSSIQSQILNLESSQLYDETKNQVCRQKIAFFKKSMVIAKGQDFDIAFKRSDINQQMDKLRLILYVNNKNARSYNCTIEYDYDREDFDVIVKKRLQNVDGRSQGRQEIQICLKNASDLGSLITAKVLVGEKMKKIVVPAMFIEFDNDFRYKFENLGHTERNLAQPLTIKPMSQFSTLNMATNVLELTREYQQKYEVGKMYGKSKDCKGIVKLTWKNGNKLKIETCEQWRTLMGYLFLNAEQTINY